MLRRALPFCSSNPSRAATAWYVEAVKPSSLRHLLWRFMPFRVLARHVNCARVDKRIAPEEHIDQRRDVVVEVLPLSARRPCEATLGSGD
jgi:hypothetical protein